MSISPFKIIYMHWSLLLMSDLVLLFVSDYLLSNNHINSIIVHKFDFSDEEVCFYVSVLLFLHYLGLM